ncbi:MAG: arylamine N-acetyltransferase [Saprospiraceae bacterium]|nr:arylamine N-acetyltransferase [Pyrinomonadaceae bacterium]
MNKEEYISRIGIDSNLSADLETLNLLQRHHLLNVPFENLDIHWKQPIILDTAKFYEKIVGMLRGGFCYELNGLFSELLREIGFETRIVSARVANGKGNFGPEYDHAAIIVAIDDTEYLADVGFGAFTTEPLRFVLNEEQRDDTGVFRITQSDDGYYEIAKKNGDGWKSEYMFQSLGRDLSEFTKMCDFQQYSPESHFTKGKVCSLLTESGRKTLTDKSFIVTSGGEKTETPIASNEEFDRILMLEFYIARPQL